MKQEALGRFLRSMREREGLSVRQLADAMDVSPSTVAGAEAGKDPRASTLESYVECIRSLSSHSVLMAATECAPAVSPNAWEYYRDLVGFSAKLVALRVTIDARGIAESRLDVQGMRLLHGSLRKEAVERTSLLRILCEGGADMLREITARTEPDLPRGPLSFEDDSSTHSYRFPAALDRHGISYRRTLRRAIRDPTIRSVERAIRFPMEALELRVRFADVTPSQLEVRAMPRGASAGANGFHLTRQLHPEGLPFSITARYAKLVVERPLVGLTYAIAWEGVE